MSSEVVTLASDLIRIDTTNTGDPDTTVGVRKAAEYVAAQLEEAGYDATYLEVAPTRGTCAPGCPAPTRRGERC